MSDPTGERFIPELMGGQLLEAEHVVRYQLASQLAAGRRVLDAGCGVGWGTAMMLAHGAASATGLDLDDDAVANARRRTPTATFVQGDLADLPWAAGTFDLVVCFEALEHVEPQQQVLDELVRVLAPDGILMVSSPNPKVYPAGNPFHVHELTPDELRDEVSHRLGHVQLWHQYTRIASLLHPADPGSESPLPLLGHFVTTPARGEDPYSLCIASRQPLSRPSSAVALAPSDQLVHLEVGSERLLADQQAFAEQQRQAELNTERVLDDHRRIVAERVEVLAEREELLQRLRDADEALRSETRAKADLVERGDQWERERQRLRRDRERTSSLLLDSEQRLAVLLATPPSSAPAPLLAPRVDLEIVTLQRVVTNLRAEIDGLRSSTSWRFTRPLRRLAGTFRRALH
ncbi:MAG: class I SAM-dependent methyltransferase [Actinomycetota bacterium]